MTQRLHRTLWAQGYNQTVSFAVQLGMVPLLIWAWGLEGYGLWLLPLILLVASLVTLGLTLLCVARAFWRQRPVLGG